MAHLALGVTTVFDPSNAASEAFVSEEMQRAGLILGPRTFSTGEIVYGARSRGTLNDIKDYDDALAHVHRLKAQGAAGIKNYNQPRRNQRQQVVAASIAENIQVGGRGRIAVRAGHHADCGRQHGAGAQHPAAGVV